MSEKTEASAYQQNLLDNRKNISTEINKISNRRAEKNRVKKCRTTIHTTIGNNVY